MSTCRAIGVQRGATGCDILAEVVEDTEASIHKLCEEVVRGCKMTKTNINIKIPTGAIKREIEQKLLDLLYDGYVIVRNHRLGLTKLGTSTITESGSSTALSKEEFTEVIGGSHPTVTSDGSRVKLYGRVVSALRKVGLPDWTLPFSIKTRYDVLLEHHAYLTHDLIVRVSDFNWVAGTYNDAGSCYFGFTRGEARAAIANSRAFIWVVHKDDPSNTPVGRMWSWPLSADGRNQFFTNVYVYGPRSHFRDLIATAVVQHFGNESPLLREHEHGVELKVDRQGSTTGLVYINSGPVYALEGRYTSEGYPSILGVLKEMDSDLVRVGKPSTVILRMKHGFIRKNGRFVQAGDVG